MGLPPATAGTSKSNQHIYNCTNPNNYKRNSCNIQGCRDVVEVREQGSVQGRVQLCSGCERSCCGVEDCVDDGIRDYEQYCTDHNSKDTADEQCGERFPVEIFIKEHSFDHLTL